jgi:hypothetical protein
MLVEMDPAREAVECYRKFSAKEKKYLKDKGISVSEVLFILFLQISEERSHASR